MSELYTEEERVSVLGRIVELAQRDERMAGCVLVGSGSYGFADEYSDIDLCMAVHDDVDVRGAFDDWRQMTESMLPVFAYCPSVRGEDIFLHNFFLTSYLEINMCFMRCRDLTARTPNWKIVLDRTGAIHDRMTRTSDSDAQSSDAGQYLKQRVSAIWHYVLHAFVASKRGRYWQAISDIEEIRNQTIRIHGLRNELESKRNRDVDGMDVEFLRGIERTLVAGPNRDEVNRALGAVARSFFDEAHSAEADLGLASSQPLDDKLADLLAGL
jgi:hypothetical protein